MATRPETKNVLLHQVKLNNRYDIISLTKKINLAEANHINNDADFIRYYNAVTRRLRLLDWSRVHDKEWCDLYDTQGEQTPIS